MHNRDRRSMLFGVGIGFCVAVAILFVAYIVQRQTYYGRINELNERVHELENLLLEAHGYIDVPNLGSVTISQEPVTTTAAEEEQTEAATEAETTMTEQNQEESTPATETTTVAQQATNPPVEGSIWVHIPANIGASEIAQILVNSGVIEDFNAFLAYLVENGFTVSLMAGNFLLPVGGEFEVIMGSILAGGL